MLDEFRRIVETATPLPVQSRLVTPDEARAVISSYNKLNDPLRRNLLSLPIENILEFSLIQAKKRPSLHSYMDGVKESAPAPEPAPEPPPAIPEAEQDHLDPPATPPEPPPPPIMEAKPKRRKPVVEEAKPEEPAPDERFFTRLLERLEQLVAPPVPPGDERHFEKLLEVEQGVLATIGTLTEKIERLSADADDRRASVKEMLTMHRQMLATLAESQKQMSVVQHKLLDTQGHIAETIGVLAEKIAQINQTPPVINPVVNVPAPIVNVTTQDGRRVRTVERDHNNLISRIVENYEDDPA